MLKKLINDKFRKSRGGSARILAISCAKCSNHLFYYQKDGPGILKRTYLDRIIGEFKTKDKLICPKCKELLGVFYLYKKERRPSMRLFAGAVTKKITSLDKI